MSVNRWRHIGDDNYGTNYQCLKCYEKWYGNGPAVWNTKWKYCPFCATQWDAEQRKSKRVENLEKYLYSHNRKYFKPACWLIERCERNWFGATDPREPYWEVDTAITTPCYVGLVKKYLDFCNSTCEVGKNYKDGTLSPKYEYRIGFLKQGDDVSHWKTDAEHIKNVIDRHLKLQIKLSLPLKDTPFAKEMVYASIFSEHPDGKYAKIEQGFLMSNEYGQGDIVEYNDDLEIVRLISKNPERDDDD